MPFVYGFLRKARRHGWRPGHPDIGLPEEPDVDPPDPDGGGGEDGDLEVGGGPILPERPSIPRPPAGIWPPMRPDEPWRPVDPGWIGGIVRPPHVPGLPTPPAGGIGGRPPERPQPGPGDGGEAGQLPVFPPGAIWPPLPPDVHGKWLALVLIAGMPGVRYRYVVIDADADMPRPGRPDNTLPGGEGEAQPKR